MEVPHLKSSQSIAVYTFDNENNAGMNNSLHISFPTRAKTSKKFLLIPVGQVFSFAACFQEQTTCFQRRRYPLGLSCDFSLVIGLEEVRKGGGRS